MKTKQALYAGITTVILSVASLTASATAIVGGLSMEGGFFALDSTGAITTVATDAVALDFNDPSEGDDKMIITGGDGNFSGLVGQVGTITDFNFASFPGPIPDFWTVGRFSFTLNDINILPETDASHLFLSGTGTISGTTFDDTFGTWRFTGDTTGIGSINWFATATAVPEPSTAVPEPTTLALLSLGLAGLGFTRGRRKT